MRLFGGGDMTHRVFDLYVNMQTSIVANKIINKVSGVRFYIMMSAGRWNTNAINDR
jgi:hypothetical protein